MKLTVEIELDQTWDGYFLHNKLIVNKDLFMEDLFSTWQKDGINNVELKEVKG